MASLITVHLNKGGSPNLGFRLQGGKDFGTPLLIQKVNVGSPAERAGLVAGDAVIKINNTDVYNLRHKDAQDVVVRAGPSFEISVQRGGSTWIPSVIPTGPLSAPSPYINSAGPVTRTSLAANKGENIGSIGTGHNLSAKPFSPQVNGSLNGGPKLVNKQYNSPLKLYSEESIAETLSAQTEVLSTGALGVNFKKNERNYDASNSEVLRALKEAENQPSYPDHEADSGVVTSPNSGIAGLRHVQAPENRPQPPQPQLPPGQNICADCERLIVGVFVRIKDKNLHVECFKCSTCGSSLKNVGYYNINNKLYCDVHAKSAALKNQTNPNLVPITIPPGGRAPAHAISSALSSHSYPTSSPLSPKLNTAGTQYQAEETNENVDVTSSSSLLAKSNVIESNTSNNNLFSNSTPVSYSKYLNNKTNYSGPKPFSSVNAPLSPHNTLPRAAPLSPVAPAPSFNSHSYTPSAYSPSSGRFSSVKPAGGLFKGDTVVSTSIDEQMRQAHLEQLKQSQSHSVERSADGLTQIQRKKVVTEEFERSQKEVNIQIEKNVSSVKKHPFTEVNVPSLGEPSIKGHVTDPQRISVKKSEGTQKEVCQKLASPLQAPPSATLQSSATASLGSTASASTPTKHVFAPSSIAPVKHVTPPSSSKKPNVPCVSQPDTGAGTGKQSAGVRIAPRRGRGILNPAAIGGARIPLCGSCNMQVRGPFITALGKIWCPNHFICSTPSCRRPLQDIGFVEERGQLYCEYCFEQYLAPPCSKCGGKIKGDCLKAIGKNFHPECFNCTYCGKLFGNSPFFLEDGSPYCDADWNELFTTKCYACAFPIEAGDRWVEALNNNYHSQCFNCTMCKKNLEGQSFFAKGGRPFCKNHAR
ncbi:unnamed protein product [Diabrotica balteata]|uniref:PDZ and LIM domain protein Zasp n=1 Tax=Diabrotica balteata TaxID=107213 RepID=A0A9P0GYD0_DIABA|nr:unnamed protein product [Diabrotica balteata]